MNKKEDNYFSRVGRGMDPRTQTCRGRLQNKRQTLNQEINKQLRFRAGAERLYKATTNKKSKEIVALELSFFNSNLQLLMEQLAELNSSMEIYQNENNRNIIPMITLGLKETNDMNFMDHFKTVISEHYGEDPQMHEDAIKNFTHLRQTIKSPSRDKEGVDALLGYFHQLCLVERRFFLSEKSLSLYFEWYDSLTGVPSCQRAIALEKASILFNVAALYTQIAAKQDRRSNNSIDASVDNLLRAAGMFHYIRKHFRNAPSFDLKADTLNMLVSLMLAQAREILFEKFAHFNNVEKLGIESCIEVSQEAAQVAEVYSAVHLAMSSEPVKSYIPYSWVSLVHVKAEHYKALSHYYFAVGLLDHIGELSSSVKDMLACVQYTNQNQKSTSLDIIVPVTNDEKRLLGKAHLRVALLLHEESKRLHRMCRQLKRIDSLQEILRLTHEKFLNKYDEVEEEDDFVEVLDPPFIQGSTKFQLTLTLPDFSQNKQRDLFHDLGPLSVFCAKHCWSTPCVVELTKVPEETFGFNVRGDSPVMIVSLDNCGVADKLGIKEGNFIVAVGDVNTKWMKHEEVVRLIKGSGNYLTMKLVSPMDRNFFKKSQSRNNPALSTVSSTGSSSSADSMYRDGSGDGSFASSTLSSKASSSSKKLSWNPFRRTKSDSSGLSLPSR